MKAKTKFDPKVVQQFVIEHTEKFVMGLVAVLFLFFAYRSYVVVGNGYQRKPEELKAATKAAFDKIALGPATKKPPAPTTKPVPDGPDFPLYAKIIDDHKLSIDAAKYPMPLGPDGSIFAPLRPREAPEVFAVENVRAIPGAAPFPIRSMIATPAMVVRPPASGGLSLRDWFPSRSSTKSIAKSLKTTPRTTPSRTYPGTGAI